MIYRKYPTRRRQAGLSMVELMIGLVLGLIVISAVFNTYVGSMRSTRFSQGLQQMQENGRYGITILQRGIRLAGYAPNGDLEPFNILASGPSTIVVRQTDLYDCNGQATAAVDGIAENAYAYDDVAKTITCTGNIGNVAMPIVEGVEAMRILWGVDTDDNGVPENYIPYSATIDPNNVVAMRVAILVSSGDAIRSRRSEVTHVLFDDEVVTDDKVAYNVFTNTVMLRNK